jgi:serine/threonine protein kinase
MSAVSYLDNYIVVNKIGRGLYSKVKEVKCPSSGTLYAAKIFNQDIPIAAASNEATIMRTVTGTNIVTVINVNLSGVYRKKNGSVFSCIYILMELCVNGDLFDIIYGQTPISLGSLQNLFHQILSAVESCHSSGICHRDVKPENILFDSAFTAKLADFGSSSRIETLQHSRIAPGKYVPPEALRNCNYNGEIGDVFSLGVVLFVMYTQTFPFFSVDSCDTFYRHFVNNTENFWKLHSQNRGDQFFTLEFKDLIEKMLNPDPFRRASLEDVKNHPWCLGTRATNETLRHEINSRRDALREIADRQLENRNRFLSGISGYKGENSSSSLSLSLDDLKVKPCNPVTFYKYTKLISGLEPNKLLGKVYDYLLGIEAGCKVSQEFYQLSTSFATEQESLELIITVYREDNYFVLDTKLIKGNNIDLMKVLKEIQELLERES